MTPSLSLSQSPFACAMSLAIKHSLSSVSTVWVPGSRYWEDVGNTQTYWDTADICKWIVATVSSNQLYTTILKQLNQELEGSVKQCWGMPLILACGSEFKASLVEFRDSLNYYVARTGYTEKPSPWKQTNITRRLMKANRQVGVNRQNVQ